MQKLIFIELNELNFEILKKYTENGFLPFFKFFFEKYGWITTTSEKEYEELEPWIQWVSIRTGKSYAEHRIFRLGDIIESNLKQHWEILEDSGFSVAAISPINGKNNTKHSKFWIPDPWVKTKISGSFFIQKLGEAIAQSVNDNAGKKLNFKTIVILIFALIKFFRFKSIYDYFRGIFGSINGYHWSRSIIFERLLGDAFLGLWTKYKPDFSTVFFNVGAHIQHHYLFSSQMVEGIFKNPDWYVPKIKDPLLEILQVYENILREVIKLDTRVIIATGLTQIPYPKLTFYYRIKNFHNLFKQLNFSYKDLIPRMSRDFLMLLNNEQEAFEMSNRIENIFSKNKENIFKVDNRGTSLFVELIYPNEISSPFPIFDDQEVVLIEDFSTFVNFVAIKNGHHSSEGYFIDTEYPSIENIPIKNTEIFLKILNHFKI